MGQYKVKQGDCISSIAYRHGLFWQTVWNYPANAALKEKCKDPNDLHPGDMVFIPEKKTRQESVSTEKKHRFRALNQPAKLRLRIMDDDQPRANTSYQLDLDGDILTGKTDEDGLLEHSILPDTKCAKLKFDDNDDEVFEIDLGYTDPITEISGLQARLINLGYNCGAVDGVIGPHTEGALRAFQKQYDLEPTGKIDEQTRNKLLEVHAS